MTARAKSPPTHADAATACVQSITMLRLKSPQSEAWLVKLMAKATAMAKSRQTNRSSRWHGSDNTRAQIKANVRRLKILPKWVFWMTSGIVAMEEARGARLIAWVWTTRSARVAHSKIPKQG